MTYNEYMSLFVTRDNQTLLWNIVNKNQKINNVFNESESDKQEWFKDIIRDFHQNGNEVYNMIQLKELKKSEMKNEFGRMGLNCSCWNNSLVIFF